MLNKNYRLIKHDSYRPHRVRRKDQSIVFAKWRQCASPYLMHCSLGLHCVCVCLLITTMSPAKTDRTIDMPFGMWIRRGPKTHV